MKTLSFIIAYLVFCVVCSFSQNDSLKNIKQFNDFIKKTGGLNKPVQNHSDEPKIISPNPIEETRGIGSKKFKITTTKYSLERNLDENIIPFQTNPNALWPGAIIQGKGVEEGILNTMGDNILRAPITITCNPGGSKKIENPTFAEYTTALKSLLKSISGNVPAKISYECKSAYSNQQALISLGIGSKWFKTSFNFENEETQINQSFIYLLKQEYYTVSTNEPSRPSDYFKYPIDNNLFKDRISTSNPLCYVSSVTYGRLLLVKITYHGTKKINENNMKSDFFAIANGKASSFQSLSVSDFSFEAFVLGGSREKAENMIANMTIKDIQDFIRNDKNYNPCEDAVPISYQVKNLSDGNLIKIGETTEYNVNKFEEIINPYQEFSITFHKFYIEKDCDYDGTRGDFLYDIDIIGTNGRSLIGGSIKNSRAIEKGDGEDIKLDKTFQFKLPNKEGYSFQLKVSLIDEDIFGIEQMIYKNEPFDYPWSKIDNIQKIIYGKLNRTCSGMFYYTIKKID